MSTAEAPAETEQPKIEHTLHVERGPLLQALTQVAPAAAQRGTSLPVLSGLRLTRVSKDKLRVTATDLDIEVSCTVAAACPKKFDVVVPSKVFRDMVREATGVITITLEDHPLAPEKDDMVVSWGRTVAILKPFPVSEWPRLGSTYDDTFTFELTAADVGHIRRIANFASRDDARPILTGICMDPKDGAVATDSYRLGIVKLAGTFPERFLMQSRVARFLPMRLLDTETATVTIEGDVAGSGYVRIECGEITIRSCLIQGEFPPYTKLIPAGSPTRATFNRADLTKAIRTAKVLCVDAIPVRIVVDEDDKKEASIRAVQQDVGQLATTVDILEHEGHVLSTCAFNVVYFQEMLDMLDDEKVTLELTDALKPVLTRDGPWTLLIMPVRVS